MGQIKIDQAGLSPAGTAGVSRTDGLDGGELVTLTNVSADGETEFRLLWGPPDDTTAQASLAVTADPDVWTFSPMAGCYGTYIIELLEDGESVERRVLGIRTPNKGLLIPAFGESASKLASWANDGADQVALSDNNAVDYEEAELDALAYAGWWRSQHQLYKAVDEAAPIGPTEFELTIATPTTWTDFDLSAACPGIKPYDVVTLVLQADLLIDSILPPATKFEFKLILRDQSGGNYKVTINDFDLSPTGTSTNMFRTPGQPFGGVATTYVMQSEEESVVIVRTHASNSWRIIAGTAGQRGATGPAGSVSGQQAITASVAVTNAVTNVSFGTKTVGAGVFQAGDVWRFTGHFTLVKTTSTAVAPIFELLVGGVVVATATTDSIGSVAETIGGMVSAFFTIKTTGASGTLDAYVGWPVSYRMGSAETSSVADKAVNTTVSNVVELRGRMSAAVASNTLTVRQGFLERVVVAA